MDKYSFDFKRIEDVLHDSLGIINPTDIEALKTQIRNDLSLLSKSIEKKASENPFATPEKVEKQKSILYRELDEIANEKSLEKVLRKCIVVKEITLLSLELREHLTDSDEEKLQKRKRRSDIFAVSQLTKSVPSIVELMEQRDNILNHIEIDNRIIKFDKTSNTLNHQQDYPSNRLDIHIASKPRKATGLYGTILEEAGINIYNFGSVTHYKLPNRNGKYTQQLNSKDLVGVIKKDEFGELKIYTVLMDDISRTVSPEFCRDIIFSDMLLRNAQNNFGVYGGFEEDPSDRIYGSKVSFREIGLEDYVTAVCFENDPSKVKIRSDFMRIKNVKEAFKLMESKMDKALRELFEKTNQSTENRGIGDD